MTQVAEEGHSAEEGHFFKVKKLDSRGRGGSSGRGGSFEGILTLLGHHVVAEEGHFQK